MNCRDKPASLCPVLVCWGSVVPMVTQQMPHCRHWSHGEGLVCYRGHHRSTARAWSGGQAGGEGSGLKSTEKSIWVACIPTNNSWLSTPQYKTTNKDIFKSLYSHFYQYVLIYNLIGIIIRLH